MLKLAQIKFSASWDVFDSQKSAKKSCVFSGSQSGHCSKFFCLLYLIRPNFNSVLPGRYLIVKRVPKRAVCLVTRKVAITQFFVLCWKNHKFNSELLQWCLIVKKVQKRAACLLACQVATAQNFFVCYP